MSDRSELAGIFTSSSGSPFYRDDRRRREMMCGAEVIDAGRNGEAEQSRKGKKRPAPAGSCARAGFGYVVCSFRFHLTDLEFEIFHRPREIFPSGKGAGKNNRGGVSIRVWYKVSRLE